MPASVNGTIVTRSIPNHVTVVEEIDYFLSSREIKAERLVQYLLPVSHSIRWFGDPSFAVYLVVNLSDLELLFNMRPETDPLFFLLICMEVKPFSVAKNARSMETTAALMKLIYWFGYDPETDDYKLVKLMSYALPPDSLDDYPGCTDTIQAKWLPSHVTFITDDDVVCGDGHDGRVHWICSTVNTGKETIVTFDLGLETFGEICLPDSVVGCNGRSWNGLSLW
ncbi:hypothetical protein OSB04_017861 [Centaurea solstitialis]|uniref:Uncharacterized protein n=1 Tax=Centaurea solstitialis TaxID=347529 RepID=A0AA38TGW1_9ASTR|nr:hypothetical protein OSB04_017861 [Centaurea solstitialis]